MQFDIQIFVDCPLNSGGGLVCSQGYCIKGAMVKALGFNPSNYLTPGKKEKNDPKDIGYYEVGPKSGTELAKMYPMQADGRFFYDQGGEKFSDLMDEAEEMLYIYQMDGVVVKKFVLNGMVKLGLIPKVEEEILAQI